MKAIQITAPSEMKVVDIEKPVLEPGEVLVKIKYVGFCGSDLNTFLGRNPMVKLPVIPGHEVGAVIEAVGKDVKVCRNTRCAFFFFIDYKNRLIFLSCDILRISLIYAFSTSK